MTTDSGQKYVGDIGRTTTLAGLVSMIVGV